MNASDWHAQQADGLMRLVAEIGVDVDSNPARTRIQIHEGVAELCNIATAHALTALALDPNA